MVMCMFQRHGKRLSEMHNRFKVYNPDNALGKILPSVFMNPSPMSFQRSEGSPTWLSSSQSLLVTKVSSDDL